VPALYAAWFKVKRGTQATADTDPVAGEPAPAS
jgi:hypothetical protein